MTIFDTAAILVCLAAVFAYLNHRFLRLPQSIGLMLIALASSVVVLLLDRFFPGLRIAAPIREYVGGIDFNKALMHGMLSFLLFAGSLHADLDFFAKRKWSIGSLATIGLLISTALVATLSYLVFGWLGLSVSFMSCLLFGALISPTDPVAVIGVLRTARAPKLLEAKIAGESLFNDGVGVVVFTVILAASGVGAEHGGAHVSGFGGVVVLFLREAVGGALLGLVTGYVAYRGLRQIDDYQVEVTITLALVMGTYALALAVHASGPLAVVVAGLLIGNRGRAFAMSETTVDYLEKFWRLVDEMLNAVLFLLIGIEIIAIPLVGRHLVAGASAIAVVLLARLVSVSVPISFLSRFIRYSLGAIRILTWSGLRGGISVALAMSLPVFPERDLIVICTYVVVLFSILVQGLTVGRLVRRIHAMPQEA